MTSGRSAGSVVCVVLAMLGLAGAIIWAILAGSAATLVSNEPGDGEYNHETSDVGAPASERWSGDESGPFGDATGCTKTEDSPPDQEFLACVADTEKEAQADASAWGAVVAARQADVQMKSDMAVTSALVGLTFAVCALALRGDTRARTQPAQGAGPAQRPEPEPEPEPEQHVTVEWGDQRQSD